MFNEGGQPQHGVVCRGGGKGGGGDSGMMQYMMEQQQAQQQQAAAAANTRTDPTTGQVYTDVPSYNAAIAQDQATAAQTAAQNEATFQTNKQSAYDAAMQSAIQAFKGQGADPNNYMNYITPALQQASSSVPDLSTNPGAYFPAGLGQSILNNATADQRTQLTNQLNQTFSPTYSSTALPTSLMDPAINTMLSNQYDPLATELQNAQKRGTLTDAGYQAALAKMNQGEAGARSQLQTLGQNILTSDRSALDTLASGARSDIAGSTLGQNIDPTQYVNQANTLIGQDTSGFGGALESAAGNVTFTDLQDLLNAGGAVQGASNPSAINPLPAAGPGGTGAIGGGGVPQGLQDQTAQAQSNRGLGNTGAF